jgi:hypothetical protein
VFARLFVALCIQTAQGVYERVLSMEGDRATALKGWATTLSSELVWQAEEDSNTLCESGIECILDKVLEEVATPEGRNSMNLAQSYNALWALCTGNGQHAEVVIKKNGFMEALPIVLDEATNELVILSCIGISGSVCVKSPERRYLLPGVMFVLLALTHHPRTRHMRYTYLFVRRKRPMLILATVPWCCSCLSRPLARFLQYLQAQHKRLHAQGYYDPRWSAGSHLEYFAKLWATSAHPNSDIHCHDGHCAG